MNIQEKKMFRDIGDYSRPIGLLPSPISLCKNKLKTLSLWSKEWGVSHFSDEK